MQLRKKSSLFLIIISATLAHGLLLFNDGFYWDDGRVFSAVRKGWNYLYHDYGGWGQVPMAYLHWTLYKLSDSLFIYKLVIFLCFLGSAFLIFELAKKSKLLTSLEALWIAMIFVSFTPVKSIPSSVSLIPYVVCYFLFFLASFLAIHSTPKCAPATQSKKKYFRILMRVCALVFFSYSFVTPSLLVFYFGFLTYWFCIESALYRADSVFRTLLFFIKSKIVFFLLPLVYWIIKIKYYSPNIEHVYYNKFDLSPISIFQNLLKHFYYIFFQEWNNFLIHVLRNPLAYLLLLTLFSLLIKPSQSNAPSHEEPLSQSTGLIFLFGAFLFFLGILPYALVGKSPVMEEFATRHALLTPLPIAIFTVIAARLLPKKMQTVRWILLMIPFTGFCIMSNENYFVWQARSIKNHSVAMHLKNHPSFGGFTEYIVVDEFKIGRHYDETSQWIDLFNKEWGEKARLVYSLEGFSVDASNHSDLHISKEKKVILRIYRARYDDERYEVLKYLYFKLTHDRRLDRFLDTFTRVEVSVLNS